MTQPRRTRSHLKSIQAETDARSYKTRTARLNAETRKHATRTGMAWDDDEVTRMVAWIEADKSSFDMAMGLGRTLFGAQAKREAIRFCMSHEEAIWGDRLKKRRR